MIWRNNSRENEDTEPKKKQCPVVDVTGDGSKVRCYKEQYCVQTWNVGSMNQGKLEVVKQKMARLNTDILQTSELKWTGMVNLTQMAIISILWEESLGRKEVPLKVNKRVRNVILRCSLKNNRMVFVHFQGKPFNITVIQVYAPTSNA